MIFKFLQSHWTYSDHRECHYFFVSGSLNVQRQPVSWKINLNEQGCNTVVILLFQVIMIISYVYYYGINHTSKNIHIASGWRGRLNWPNYAHGEISHWPYKTSTSSCRLHEYQSEWSRCSNKLETPPWIAVTFFSFECVISFANHSLASFVTNPTNDGFF